MASAGGSLYHPPVLPRLSVLLLIAALPLSATAQEDISDFEELDLEKLLNTVSAASKREQDITESPSAITVIDREMIENTHCTDIVCLLRQVPEVDVIRMKPMYAAVGARALTDVTGNKVLLLVDGWDVNLDILGYPLWQALPVHMADIERIEVIRGPGSSLYGANAHSIVVSIITRKPEKHTAEVFIGSGEYDRSSLHLRLSQRLGDWSLLLSGGGDLESNWGVFRDREREAGRLRLRIGRETGSSVSTLMLGLTTIDGLISTLFGGGEIANAYTGDVQLFHRTDFLQARAWYTFYTGEIPIGNSVEFQGIRLGKFPGVVTFFSHTMDAEAQVNWSPFEGNLLVAGGDYRWIVVMSEDLAPDETNQHRIGLFVHDEQRLGENLILTGGLRFDFNSITPETFSPRLAGLWKFSPDQSLRLSFGMAFRKPAFFETSLHLKGIIPEPGFEGINDFMRRSVGNKDLGNESIMVFEAGYVGRFLDARLTVEAGAFYNRYRDTVNFHVNILADEFGVPDLSRSEALYLNEGREVDSVGGSIGATYRVLRTLRLSANYTFRHSWYIADSPLGSHTVAVEKGDRVAFEPAHLFNLSFYHLLPGGLRWGMGLHACSKSDWTIVDAGIFGNMHDLHNPANWMLSAFGAWRLAFGTGFVEIGIRAYNLSDTAYRDVGFTFNRFGKQMGGFYLGRRIFFYLKGAI
jgi:iron complex outermembrane receptor protein